mmetsp:Transcript_101202/g.226093  ORF Transcript_101202/g.226093 Transcript_101202/m.226093 type:complete len:92 (+) Transcript_101202:113-388(+)
MQPMVMVKTRAMKAMAGAVPMPEVQAMDLVDGEGEMDGIPLGTQNIRIMQPKGTVKTRAMKAIAGAVPMPEVQAMDIVDCEGEMDGIPLGT